MTTPRSALVAGATGGIGSAIAAMLAAEGFDLTLVARKADRLAALAASLPDKARVQTIAADVTDEFAVTALLARHADAYGALDVLVNAAGGASPHPRALIPTDALDEQWSVNLRAPVILVRCALDLLGRAAGTNGRAHVVLIGSLTGEHPVPYLAAYSAMKAGISAYAQALNSAYARDGIFTSVLSPAAVDTPMAVDVPMDRDMLIDTEDLAVLVRALISLSGRSYVPSIPVLRRGSKIISPI